MDKPSLSVDELLRLAEGLKAKGVNHFKWDGNIVEWSMGPISRQGKRKSVVPEKPEPKNAVDLALDLNGRGQADDEDV